MKQRYFGLAIVCLTLMLCVSAFADTINNPVAWYKFDETSGTAVADSSGNGFDAVISGTTNYVWESEGAVGGCLNNHITNNNLYIPVPTAVFSTIDKQATFTFWVQLTELSDAGLQCGGFFTGNAGSTKLAWARPYKQGSGVYPNITLTYNLGTSTSNAWWSDFDEAIGNRDEWGHIAIVFDAVAGIRNLYVNGMLIAAYSSNAVLPTDSLAGIDAFNIFHATSTGAGSWDSFHGKMDDFRIYDQALSGEEINLIMTPDNDIAFDPIPDDGQTGVDKNLEQIKWSASDFVNSHNVYFGTDAAAVENATIASDEFQVSVPNDVNYFDLPTLETGQTYYWRIDEIYSSEELKGDIWTFTVLPANAWKPKPVVNAIVAPDRTLIWSKGEIGNSYDIYFGTDYDQVQNADHNSPAYKGNQPIDANSYDPKPLELGGKYYWRVEQIDSSER
ncbi:MAG: LamG domain-containing protein [Planctomycetes bacterium]|nr:LamG domain-containing protein [Planctomycetota bacterium]